MQKHVDTPVIKSLGIVGSRDLPMSWVAKVEAVVEDVLGRGYHVATGGALGTDHFVLESLLVLGQASKGIVHGAWKNMAGFPGPVRPTLREFCEQGGTLRWGQSQGKGDNPNMVKVALLMRNQRLVEACYGVVAFLAAGSKGTLFTLGKAASKRCPLVVFPACATAPAGKPAFDARLLPALSFVKWVPLRCGGCWSGAFKAVYIK